MSQLLGKQLLRGKLKDVRRSGAGPTGFIVVTAYTLPLAPTGLTATPNSDGSIQLAWTNNSGSATVFEIQGADSASSDFQTIDQTDAGAGTYTDQSIPAPAINIKCWPTAATVTSDSTFNVQVLSVHCPGLSYGIRKFSAPATPLLRILKRSRYAMVVTEMDGIDAPSEHY